MGKTWVLDTETKGTGAHMVPLEKTLEDTAPKRAGKPVPARGRAPTPSPRPASRRPIKAAKRARSSLAPLPHGHVRKKATGEVGRVKSVDARAGTATVLWLRQGRTSTVALSAISRR